MKTETLSVPLDAIDLTDLRFVMTFGREAAGLEDSIKRIGLINPPVLARAETENSYRVVCGYLRLQAIGALGETEIPARLCGPEADEKALLLCALHDNLAARAFNPVEKALAVKKLLAFLPADEVASAYLPLLGLPPTLAALEETLMLLRLEGAVLEALARGGITEKNAVRLSALSREDREALFHLFVAVNLSASKQAEVMEYCGDMARRDAAAMHEILGDPAIAAILCLDRLTLAQKSERIRQHIRKLRFPVLSQQEERFALLKKKLHLPRGTELAPPPYFEGSTYRLSIAFETADELKAAAEAVVRVAAGSAMEELLEEKA